MALQIQGLKRVFIYTHNGKRLELGDLNMSVEPEQVKNLYCDQYPELATATVSGPVMKSDRIEYSFTAKAGTKG